MLVIGDVHGELELLKAMISNVNDENVYLVGDLIDRGEKSIEVLQYVMQKKLKTVKGNHELSMLTYLQRKTKAGKAFWFSDGGEVTLKAYMLLTEIEQKDILAYLSEVPLYYYIAELDVLISHSGINPTKLSDDLQDMLKEHNAEDFTNIRSSFIYSGAISYLNTSFLVGHTPSYEINADNGCKLLRKGNRFFLDTGATSSGVLGALQIIGNELTAHYVNEELKYWNENFGYLREENK
ncbi:MAG TPA: metallophosphoesterase [Clostridium sp.]